MPEEAIPVVLHIVRKEGIFVGLSSGTIYIGYKRLVKSSELDEGEYILVFPDLGLEYVE